MCGHQIPGKWDWECKQNNEWKIDHQKWAGLAAFSTDVPNEAKGSLPSGPDHAWGVTDLKILHI